MMKNFLSVSIAALLSISTYAQKTVTDTTFVIILAPQHTWGYDISIHNKVLIHQPNVPGMPGNTGFATQQDASKAAKLVLQKLHKGLMPPTVSLEELKRLRINFKKQ